MVVLEELQLLRFDQGQSKELLSNLSKDWSPTNAQFTVAMAAFLAYCVILVRLLPGKLFAVWWAVGIHAFFTGCLRCAG